MSDVAQLLNQIVWSPFLVALCLLVGLYCSIRTRFIQVWGIPRALKIVWTSRATDRGVSAFQALSMTVMGRVGIGNIAGVAAAIAFGGPGAVFWMWVVALVGAASAFVESTLAQIYKEVGPDGNFRGGPAFYIRKATGRRWLAATFAVLAIVSTGMLLPLVQANGIYTSMYHVWQVSSWHAHLMILVPLAVIVLGGLRRIAHFASTLAPVMALTYVLITGTVIVMHLDQVPQLLGLIVRSAFGAEAAFGAMIGAGLMWGIKRGAFSNEAGHGTGAHAAAAADVKHPVEQGLVQALSVYIDTLVICTATALAILTTGAFNIVDAAGQFIVAGLPGVAPGPAFVQEAMNSVWPGYGAAFVAIAIFAFAFTSIIGFYYIAETNLMYLFGRSRGRGALLFALRCALLLSVSVGINATSVDAWALGEVGFGLVAWINLFVIAILAGTVDRALRDYRKQCASGQHIHFSGAKFGLGLSSVWSAK